MEQNVLSEKRRKNKLERQQGKAQKSSEGEDDLAPGKFAQLQEHFAYKKRADEIQFEQED